MTVCPATTEMSETDELEYLIDWDPASNVSKPLKFQIDVGYGCLLNSRGTGCGCRVPPSSRSTVSPRLPSQDVDRLNAHAVNTDAQIECMVSSRGLRRQTRPVR